MLMIVGEALIGRRGICRGTGAFRVQVVVIGDLFTQKSQNLTLGSGLICLHVKTGDSRS